MTGRCGPFALDLTGFEVERNEIIESGHFAPLFGVLHITLTPREVKLLA